MDGVPFCNIFVIQQDTQHLVMQHTAQEQYQYTAIYGTWSFLTAFRKDCLGAQSESELSCTHTYNKCTTYLLTYLLHGAESFLRS